jgi:hypothetical protein
MRTTVLRLWWMLLVIVASADGCARGPVGPSSTPGGSPPEAEGEVRQKFLDLQAAIKARDNDRIWGLLHSKSQADAEERARVIRTAYERASPEDRAKQAEEQELSGEKLARLTGKTFLDTWTFRRKASEVAESTIDRVTAGPDSGTVYFTEPDNDKEKMPFLREDGQWMAWMTMPRVRKR